MSDDELPTRPIPPLHTHRRAEDPRAQPCDLHDEQIEELRLDVARLDRRDAQLAERDAGQAAEIAALRRDVDRHESRLEDTGRRDLSVTQRELERLQDAERVRLAEAKADAARLVAAEHAKESAALAVRSARLWDVVKTAGPWAVAGIAAGGMTAKVGAFVQWLMGLFHGSPPKGH